MYNLPSDPTAKKALLKYHYAERIKIIEKASIETDPYLYSYILKGFTEEKPHTYLKECLVEKICITIGIDDSSGC